MCSSFAAFLFFNLLVYFSQSQFIYETDDTYSQYIGAGFNFFTVYHHSHQQEEVHATIINPLVNIFRPFFVFISVDM